MCDPATAIAVTGGLFTAYGQYQQGEMANATAKYNARQLENEAVRTRNVATEKENDHRRMVAEFASKQRAQFGAAGVSLNSGTPSDILTDTIDTGEIDAMRIRRTADDQVQSLNDQAKLTRDQGKNAKSAAKMAAFGTLLGTAGAAAGPVSSKWYTPKSAAMAPGVGNATGTPVRMSGYDRAFDQAKYYSPSGL